MRRIHRAAGPHAADSGARRFTSGLIHGPARDPHPARRAGVERAADLRIASRRGICGASSSNDARRAHRERDGARRACPAVPARPHRRPRAGKHDPDRHRHQRQRVRGRRWSSKGSIGRRTGEHRVPGETARGKYLRGSGCGTLHPAEGEAAFRPDRPFDLWRGKNGSSMADCKWPARHQIATA